MSSRGDGPDAVPASAGQLAALVVELALGREVRIASAESLTGGLLADALVSVPGVSAVYSGGIVAYDTWIKHSLLGVEASLLDARGPVDDEVARQMARGARRACAAPRGLSGGVTPVEVGIATTGVAGPDPDPQTGQPAGRVWIGVSSALGERAVLLDLSGDRAGIRSAAVAAALGALLEELRAL